MINLDDKILSTKLSEELKSRIAQLRIPISGGIELTNKCNFRCIHCYEANERDSWQTPIQTERMLELIDQLESAGVLSVFLTGGEAMLHPDFRLIYEDLRDRGILVSILTNGTTITPNLCKLFVRKAPTMIDISIYGADNQVYQKITGVKDGFSRLKAGLDLLKLHKLPFQLKAILMKENVHQFDAMKRIADEYGVSFSFYGTIRPQNSGAINPVEHRLALEEYVNLELSEPRVKQFLEMKINQSKTRVLSPRQQEGKKYLCRIAQNSFFITFDGQLNGCVRSRRTSFDLRNGSFLQGWKELENKLCNAIEDIPSKCATCDNIELCEFCPGEFEIETGSPSKPSDYHCQLAEMRKRKMEELKK